MTKEYQFSPFDIIIHNQEKMWESIKQSPRGKCFDLQTNSLN